MPTYEYACRKCEHHFEIFQSMKADSLLECPECGREALHRLIGRGAGIIFKGSGFYETDYRREAAPAATDGSSSPESSSSEKSSTEKASPDKTPTEKSPSAEKSSNTNSTSSGGQTTSTTQSATS